MQDGCIHCRGEVRPGDGDHWVVLDGGVRARGQTGLFTAEPFGPRHCEVKNDRQGSKKDGRRQACSLVCCLSFPPTGRAHTAKHRAGGRVARPRP
jgi:hypothetical protein